MEIRISKESRVPLHEQISSQLVLLIATRKLQPGEALPSVRTLARKLQVHHNTVSEAMQYLVKWNLVVRRRGARMVINDPSRPGPPSGPRDLDELITDFLTVTTARGIHAAEVLARLQQRLTAGPPARVLALSFDPGMRQLLETELRAAITQPVESLSPEELQRDPQLASGALVIAPPGVLPCLGEMLPPLCSPMPAHYTDPEAYLEAVRQLRDPSIIALVSISEGFLEIARGVLGPLASGRHSLIERRIPLTGSVPAPPADLIFCDVVAARRLARRPTRSRVLIYPLLSATCIEGIRRAMS